ncbi:MAG: hypothetical protein Q9202_006760 [Teloschistes flavicans]
MPPKILLTLPAEIRNRIYREVVVFDGIEIIEEFPTFFTPGHTSVLRLSPGPTPCENIHELDSAAKQGAADIRALLLVNRQIYNEALPIFLGENRFSLDCDAFFSYFVNGIGANRMPLLGDITLYMQEDESYFDDSDDQMPYAPSFPGAMLQDWHDFKSLAGEKLKLRLWYWDGPEEDSNWFWERLVRMGILCLEGKVDFWAVHSFAEKLPDENPRVDTERVTVWKGEKGSPIRVVVNHQLLPLREIQSYFPGLDLFLP